MNRAGFLGSTALALGGSVLKTYANERRFKISLAQWSLRQMHETKRGQPGYLDPLNFGRFAMDEFGIDGVEYVNTFYEKRKGNAPYFAELKKRNEDSGVKSLLIMCDGCGRVGSPDKAEREETLEKHKPWIDTAAMLGCHSIRVNAQSEGSFVEQQLRVATGLRLIADYARDLKVNVLVENHGGLSSNGAWLAGVMEMVDMPNVGTLPDFGNFKISETEEYDRYKGVEELMPFARAVSAKSHEFDAEGNEVNTDYFKMMKIIAEFGYRGYIGVEWEGDNPGDPIEGVKMTMKLLMRAFTAVG